MAVALVAPAAALVALCITTAMGAIGGNAENTRRVEEAERQAADAAAAAEEERRRREETEKNTRLVVEEAERQAAEAATAEKGERKRREETEKNARLVVEKAKRRAADAAAAEEKERKRREETEKKFKHERRLRELGIEPNRQITKEEIRGAKQAVGYAAGKMNIAVVGRQNEGKSSLVNSLRGIGPGHPGSAMVREGETTKEPTAFVDETHEGVVWHDVPGGGTSKFSGWGYYYDRKLYAYDKILLVHSSALSELDIRIMQLCVYMKKECIVARTKADMHIRNCMRNKRHLSVTDAREDYVCQVWEETDEATAKTSETETLRLEFTDFIISEIGVLQTVNCKPPPDDLHERVIDEERFLRQLGLGLGL